MLAVLGASMISSLPADEVIRIMAANTTSGTLQSYPTDGLGPAGGLSGPGNRIFQGLDPDIALVQEMNVGVSPNKNTPATYRAWVDGNFGTSFSYRVENASMQLPNGIISRFPILDSGVWDDPSITNREFIWAKIDIPGDKNLWAISVHLSSGGGSSARQTSAIALRNYIVNGVFSTTNPTIQVMPPIPATDYLVIGGDFNTDNRTEACITTLSSVLVTASPYPVDQNNNGNTNASRAKPYDWVIPDADLNALSTPLVIGTRTFANGLVYDSRVTAPYTFVPTPILGADSGAASMQHMAVMRAFLIPTNDPPTIAASANSSSTETVSDPDLYEIVRGTSVGLSVLGADDGGEAALKYTWSVTSGIAGAVSFTTNGTNAAKNTTANFTAIGNYTLTATVQDVPGLSVTSFIRVRVVQKASSLVLNPTSASLAVNATQVFTATLRDQFIQTMPGAFIWSATGGGTINTSGLFTATTAGGPFAVGASSSGLSANAGISVSRAVATVALNTSSLNQTYDGNPKIVTATTNPPGLALLIVYSGSSTAPINAGSYPVTATITDANYQGSAAGSLVIAPAPWALWKNTYFNQAERTAGLADDPMDPDDDGFTNLAEYALGANPRTFTAPLSFVMNPNGLSITFTRPQNLPGIIYAAQASSDLLDWSSVPMIVTIPGFVETVNCSDPPPLDPSLPRFLRLSFERQ